ncbi:MAG TPA: alcohol dehydrogenase catalytic domain-containing protein [Acidimicrobiia bacterium]|jgi:threonine dehydrogenase-like Zn-dependent dehydrogenase
MRGVCNTERGIEVLDLPDPDPGTGVRVAVRSAGICGSDLHMIGFGPIPFPLGHELGGVLDDGTPVAIDPNDPCGACDQCDAGHPQRCRSMAQRARGTGTAGGMADAIVVDESALVPCPSGLDAADACLVEPVGVAVHGLRIAGLSPGDRVAVVGAGSIGLAAVSAARPSAGAVALVARHDHQRAAGERLGATSTVDGEYDVVVECAGTEDALARAVDLCRPGGTVLFLSTHWVPVTIPGIPALMKELGFRWAITYGIHDGRRDLDDAAEILAADPTIADVLITHRFPLDEAAEAFRVAADRASGSIKVVLEP